MSLGDTFLPCADLFSGAGHVGQRLFAGAPQAEIFVSSSSAQKPDILWLLLIPGEPGHFEALQPI